MDHAFYVLNELSGDTLVIHAATEADARHLMGNRMADAGKPYDTWYMVVTRQAKEYRVTDDQTGMAFDVYEPSEFAAKLAAFELFLDYGLPNPDIARMTVTEGWE